jgi:hypothetical protein
LTKHSQKKPENEETPLNGVLGATLSFPMWLVMSL